MLANAGRSLAGLSAVERATDDPYLLRRMGEMQAQISGAALMADHGAEAAAKATGSAACAER